MHELGVGGMLGCYPGVSFSRLPMPTPLFFHSSGEIFITEVGVLISSFNVSREKGKIKAFATY